MMFKRLLSFLLALVMVLCLLPVGALATEQSAPEKSGSATLPFQLNPLYEGLIDPEALIQAYAEYTQEEEDSGGLGQEAPALYATTYNTPETAAYLLRSFMKSRVRDITLYVQSPSADYESLIYQITDDALIHTGDPIEGDYLMWQYGGWTGDVDWETENGVYNYCFTLTYYYYTTAEQEKQLDTAVAQLLESLNVRDKSDYEKVRIVYDYVCENVTYDYEHLYDENYTLQYTAYGALMDKTAVCQGYAVLMYRLLLDLGLDARLIPGQSFGENHGWNIVRLGNVYYHLDSTWDAGMEEYSYFLTNVPNFQDHTRFPEYETTAFHMAYPMSATDYVDGVAGEPEWAFARGQCGEDAYWTVDRDQVLTIYGTGATDNYTAYADSVPWYSWNDGFNSVVVEEGITELGSNIFYDLDQVVSATLPASLTQLGTRAFYDCDGLTQLTISTGLQTIPASTFSGCDALTEVTVPANVVDLYGFDNCTNLRKVTIHSRNVGVNAFAGCKNLSTVILSDSVNKVNPLAFNGCTALTRLTVPASVSSFSIAGCTGMKAVIFQGHAPSFDSSAFLGVTAQVYYPAGDSTWAGVISRNYGGSLTWIGYETGTDSSTPMYRLYNPNTGEHFYTASLDERIDLVIAGWHYEGVAWNAPTQTGDPVYRLYNPISGDHHYTMSADERDMLTDVGWNYEGVCWNSAPAQGNLPLYRLYNPNAVCGSHHYTGSEAERDMLVSAGWIYEGIGWYGVG